MLQKMIKINSTKALHFCITEDENKFELRISQLFADPIEKITDEDFLNNERSVGVSLNLNKIEYIQLVNFLGEYIKSQMEIVEDKNDIIDDVNTWLNEQHQEDDSD